MKKFVCILAAVIFAILAIVPASFAESNNTRYIVADNGKTVNLRKAPNGTVIAHLGVGKVVTVLENNGDWKKVSVLVEGVTKKGYVKSEFLSRNDPSLAPQYFHKTSLTVRVTPSKGINGHVNLRADANTQSTIRAYLEDGELLTVLAESNAWYKVRTENGVTGYVVKAFVDKFNV